ncbi:hypothetical protein Lesp02_77040 [Lentzea sp. NBRC 105346]|uniref:YncE family protein n=1 Tax=Lentzea sp. NBRC 105346 TaxID=3032205 RepID=UPI0024A0D49E|nr:YncE family protein [Lentzea sp. NBRC 105346]GLZ35517.1 hypothetical protein Lesp02_77040 [Lentzea sp. NBRC 105346]
MTNEARPLSRRTLLAAALGGAAAGVVGQSLFASPALAAAGRKTLLIGSVDHFGGGFLQLADPGFTGTPASVALSGQPNGITSTADGRSAYVAQQFGPGLSVVDVAAGKVTAEFEVGGFATAPVLSPDGKLVYVATGSSAAGGSRGHVVVVDAASGEVRARIEAGLLPQRLAITPDGTRLFVADERAKGISVIDTARNEVAGTIKTEQTPLFLAVDDKGSRLFAAAPRELVTYDLRNGNAGGKTDLPGRPGGLALHPGQVLAVVSLYTGNSKPAVLATVNVQANRIVTQSDNARANGPLTLSKDGARTYVIDKENRKTTSADTSTGKPDNALSTPDSYKPTCVAYVETA